jgi:hypothetical protein
MTYRDKAFELKLQVLGEHMALNALGAFLAGVAVGASPDDVVAGLAVYDGVRRRFELKGRFGGVSVYDDYAHHPVKVAAQLRAARQLTAARGRLIVAFQPHLYSRTLEFTREFGTALALADEVVVLDIYGAREDPIPGINGGLIARAVPLPPERAHYVPERSEVPPVLAGLASSGDIIITMAAGGHHGAGIGVAGSAGTQGAAVLSSASADQGAAVQADDLTADPYLEGFVYRVTVCVCAGDQYRVPVAIRERPAVEDTVDRWSQSDVVESQEHCRSLNCAVIRQPWRGRLDSSDEHGVL